MDRTWLEDRIVAGRSLAEIGIEAGRHPSTVGYWLNKHGLKARGSARFAAKGAPDRGQLAELAMSGATLREMAGQIGRSVATVRYWLRRWQIDRAPRPVRRPINPTDAPAIVTMRCDRHGAVAFCLEGRGYYRCTQCRQQYVSAWRRRVKETLVAEAVVAASDAATTDASLPFNSITSTH